MKQKQRGAKLFIAIFILSTVSVFFDNQIAIDPVVERTQLPQETIASSVNPQKEKEELTVDVIATNQVLTAPYRDERPAWEALIFGEDKDAEVDQTEEIIALPDEEPTIVNGGKTVKTVNDRFILGAATQFGVTNSYDGAYKKLAYPNGDVDVSTGVCTDVIIRAFRAVDIDLQKEIHKDMKRHFRKYPKKWGLKSTDRNIDHRRVPNMERYFTRKGYQVPIGKGYHFNNYLPGDLVVWRINGDLTHIGIVSDQKVPESTRHYIIHNPFQGVEISDWLTEFKIINHFRVFGDQKS
ncbi:MAG: DUF1287 domain-containing protein [Cocleimonas sp.]|nr:DUF1287 domain-containing protein [Cocleimonas sp.]